MSDMDLAAKTVMATSKSRKKRLLLTLLVAPLAFGALLFSDCGPIRSVTRSGVSAEVANDNLWNCLVPQDASDVWFVSAYRSTKVECTLPKKSFVEWCEKNGWNLSQVDSEVPKYSLRDGPITIRKGLRFSDFDGDLGFGGLYDEDHERAYVVYTGG